MLPLRAAINEAKKENKTAPPEPRPYQAERRDPHGERRSHSAEKSARTLLPDSVRGCRKGARGPSDRKQRRARNPAHSNEAKRIAELEGDLAETREYLQSLQEQHEAANEELQAANEEVQSANEELQSINEELETSKEELESANEELTTVNEEMSNRNVELNRLNNDLVNLQTSSQASPSCCSARNLTIRRFSPQAEKQFDLLATDVGHGRSARSGTTSCSPDAAGSPVDLESPQRRRHRRSCASRNARCATRTAAGIRCACAPT